MWTTKRRSSRRRTTFGLLVAAIVLGSSAPTAAEPVGVPVPTFRAGTVVTWGATSWGLDQLPANLAGRSVSAIAAGNTFSMALTADGTVAAWGNNDNGQTSVPTSLAGRRVTAIAAGYLHALALTSEGTVIAWGRNASGQTDVPASLAGKTVTAIAAGNGHSLALTSEGSVTAWGYNGHGQTNVPASLAGKTVTAIAAGNGHSLALTSDGRVTGWGRNDHGQGEAPDSLADKAVTAIAAGDSHSVALTGDGAVTAWGRGDFGQIDVPPGLSDARVIAVAAGLTTSWALTADGKAVGWGENGLGQATAPSSLEGRVVTAVAAGGAHAMSIATDFAPEHGPHVSGVPYVGGTVTATTATYSLDPDAVAHQWYADGVAIPGATASSYAPTTADEGKRLSVQVSATLAGYPSSVTTSAPTQPVMGPPTIRLSTPTSALRRGQSATLTWSSTFASTVSVSGAWSGSHGPEGSLTVRPDTLGTATYVLSASNPAGAATTRIQITVTRPATRLRLKAEPGRAGTKVAVTVRGLEKGERYTIRLGRKTLVQGIVTNTKPLVREVRLPRKPGRATIRATGDQPDRTGTTKVRISRR